VAAHGSDDIVILLGYDGSADARAAIEQAGLLMAGSEATVLVTWETILESAIRYAPLGQGVDMSRNGDDGDAAIKRKALGIATEGTQRAIAAGLLARPRIANCTDDIAEAILAEAADLHAAVIVVGTRGLGRLKSLMLGGVARGVVHHADRPVLVVPSPRVAEQRHHFGDRAERGA
jgi:nucleotide-binding universal stress UspA family protein